MEAISKLKVQEYDYFVILDFGTQPSALLRRNAESSVPTRRP
jgi:hypothetical protein